MGLIKPTPPPYDPMVWSELPFPERARRVCEAWALQGYGAPIGALFAYGLKVLAYVGGWAFFCAATPGHAGLAAIESWWLEPLAFQKAILWSLAFEALGLGCGSGPLTGRYFPPVGGFLYFLRPGTTKLPLFTALGTTRTFLDVALYLALYASLARALLAPVIDRDVVLPIVGLLALIGVLDKTIFLAARAEHYFTTAVCFAFAAPAAIAGAKIVMLGLWFWAGVSKLNHHFPAVVCVMTSNSPLTPSWLRKRMYKRYPSDLSPSTLAVWMAHGGGLLEFAVPLVLAFSSGGTGTLVGMVLMLGLHVFITSNVPMGVPIEWNVMMVYGATFLFWGHAGVSVTEVAGAPLLALFVLVAVVLVPLLGNLFPRAVSFLLAMRYYAGNWAYSVWLFEGDSYRKLDHKLVKSSAWVYDQLARFYDLPTSVGLVGKVLGFRSMHLHGRALQRLLPKAVARVEDYEYVDGELVAGLVLGWNFGDGHLHDERLLAAVQKRCGFLPGELRCVFVEAQPLFRPKMAYRIHDASTGVIEEGELDVAELRAIQPWPNT